MTGKFSCRNNPSHEHIFHLIFRQKNVPDYKYIIPLCIQYACKIVLRMGRLSKDGLFEIIQYDLSM